MNRNLRLPTLSVDLGGDYNHSSTARSCSDWHADEAEHHAREQRMRLSKAHRDVSELYATAAFSFDRAARAVNAGRHGWADNHRKRGKELVERAHARAEQGGLKEPEIDLSSVLGVSHGSGPKVGGI